jgi:dihydroorotase-like cyclic amidohydrolase
MNPPLRGPDDINAMVEGVRSGLIDVIASDHAPHSPEEKKGDPADAPSGVPGFETLIPSILTCFEEKGIPPSNLVSLGSINPSRIFEIPGKGYGVGKDADFVVIDAGKREVDPDLFYSRAKYSPFSGMTLKYWPTMTILRGMVISEGDEIIIKDAGRFVPAGNDHDR